MAAKTMGERVSAVEQWQADHESRCDDRQTAMGREIRDLKKGVGSLTKGAWGVVLGLLAWLAVQVYNDMRDRQAAPPPAPAQASLQR